MYVTSHFQFYDGISVVRSWSEVENRGKEAQGLEYVSSFNLQGIEKEGVFKRDDKMSLMIPHNSRQREMQWQPSRERRALVAEAIRSYKTIRANIKTAPANGS